MPAWTGWSRSRWYLALLLIAAVTRAPVFLHPFLNGDEATYTALANAMLDGHWLYAGAVDHKPPLVYATYAALLGLFGRYALQAVHAVSIMVVGSTGFVLGGFVASLGAAPAVARTAAALFVVASAIGPGQDVLAANAEIFMLLPSVGAMAVLGAGTRPAMGADARPWNSFGAVLAAGVCIGLASLYKYQAAATLWPALVLSARRGRWLDRTRLAIGLCLGALLPAAVVIVVYERAGHLDALRFWAWTFPLRYAGAVGPARALANAALGTLAWGGPLSAVLLLAWLGCRHRPDDPATAQTLTRVRSVGGAWLVASIVGVSGGGRFVFHYYLQLLPPVCVLAAVGLSCVVRPGAMRRALAAALVMPLVAFWLASAADPFFRREVARDAPIYRDIAAFLRTHAGPADTLLVWGGSSQIYVLARMPLGTRFPFCNYQTGKMWSTTADLEGAANTADFVVRESWPMLVEDLATRAPTWIVDAGEAGLDRWRGHPLGRYPPLARIVQREYVDAGRVDGATIYRRR